MSKELTNRVRKIYLLDRSEDQDHFERLFAISNPKILAAAESTAILLDSAVDEKGEVSLPEMIKVVKEQDDLSIVATLKNEVSPRETTVGSALETLRHEVSSFWNADLNFVQQEFFITLMQNVLLNLEEQEDLPWINWLKKGKHETSFQYNLFLASDPPKGGFMFFEVPVLLTITIAAPYKDILNLKESDQICWQYKAEGLKLAELFTDDYQVDNSPAMVQGGRKPSGIIVSAHGGRWSNVGRGLEIPKGSSIAYFVRDGEILSDEAGEAILRSLVQGEWPREPVVQVRAAGEETYNYECWFAPQWASDCGIFEVGTGRLLLSLERFTEQNPLPLSEIIRLFPGRTIFWDACRSVTSVDEFAHHVVPAQSYLAVPHRAPLAVESEA